MIGPLLFCVFCVLEGEVGGRAGKLPDLVPAVDEQRDRSWRPGLRPDLLSYCQTRRGANKLQRRLAAN